MYTIKQMNKWDYSTAWQFFTNNAVNRYIPETELYLRSLKITKTIDLRYDKGAREKILESLKPRTLILIDGASINGKSTFAGRLARNIGAEVVDIDIICKEWMDEQLKNKNCYEKKLFMLKADQLTDVYVLENLEKIIRKKSNNTVILVGSYLEVIYRSIISKTLGKYFEQVISIYCCSKGFKDLKMMLEKRESQMGEYGEMRQRIFSEYDYSKRLLKNDGIVLGIGMDASFIADISVSDMFV